MLRSPRVLVAARVLAGLTQPELAAAAGIAPSVLGAIEQGRSDPRLSTVLAILDALKARGVELAPETDQVAWGVHVSKGSEAAAALRRPDRGSETAAAGMPTVDVVSGATPTDDVPCEASSASRRLA
jgi:transcriptional regulator with XRE-family HTH domain